MIEGHAKFLGAIYGAKGSQAADSGDRLPYDPNIYKQMWGIQD